MNIPRWEKFAAAADNHGIEQDDEAVAAFLRFVKEFKPKHRIHMGDGFNFAPLRRKASEDERRQDIREDMNVGKRFIEEFRPTDYLLGNHEFRIYDTRDTGSGLVQQLCTEGIKEIEKLCRYVGSRIYPYDTDGGILTIGSLNFLHGFYVGVNAARRHAADFDSCLFGHVHTIAEAPVPGRRERVARSIGCLCKLRQPYNARTPSALQHRHGWAYGVINKVTGDYLALQARKVGDQWLIPSEIQIL